jgi:serine/threonine protein kinase
MTVASRCPDAQQLQQLLLGRLGEEAAASLEQHVEQCRRCGRLLPRLPAEDTLVEAMRSHTRVALQPADRQVVRGLLPRLHRLRTAGPAAHATAVDQPDSADRSPGHSNQAVLDLLNPPRRADEIGRLGPYRVLNLLGQGGMGVVFLAEDPHLRRKVALKVMRPDVARKPGAKERFVREARAAAMLEHDQIVTIFQVGEDRGIPFLAMQLLKGMSLEDFLKNRERAEPGTPLPPDLILKLGREIALGLAAAHEKGLIHRDVKPANIWLDATAGGRVKLLDFGLARPAEGDTRLTQVGMLLGTPAYMAPEQVRDGPIDGRADLFGLGCVLYRLCTGRLPWKGGDTVDTLVAVAREEPTPVQVLNPDLSPDLARLVMQLLAKRPEDRPGSANAVVQAVQAVERELPTPNREHVLPVAVPESTTLTDAWQGLTEAIGTPTRGPALRGRSRWLRRLGVLAGLSVLALAGAFLCVRIDTGPSKGEKGKEPGATRPKGAQSSPVSGPAKSLVNSIGMKLAYIPPGKFRMGSSASDIARIQREPFKGYDYPGYEQNEGPQHEVRIARGFYLGVYEVTQGQYEPLMGHNPSGNKESPQHPVERVLWDDAAAFCARLSELPDEKQAGRLYRLPTEAEWEYACRAGTTTLFHYGDSLSSWQANIDANRPFGTAEKGPQHGKTVRVGSYEPNAWGLFDMHGNVWEWCQDGQRTYTAHAVEDPRGPETASGARVLRGGGWRRGACRSAFRKERGGGYRIDDGGFRVACFPAATSSADNKKGTE